MKTCTGACVWWCMHTHMHARAHTMPSCCISKPEPGRDWERVKWVPIPTWDANGTHVIAVRKVFLPSCSGILENKSMNSGSWDEEVKTRSIVETSAGCCKYPGGCCRRAVA